MSIENIGISYPIDKNTHSGYFTMNSEIYKELNHNIINFLLTNHGERFCHYNFGANIKALVFDQSREETITIIRENIISGINKWFPFVEILKLDIQCNKSFEERNSILITLKYKVKGLTGEPQTLQQIV